MSPFAQSLPAEFIPDILRGYADLTSFDDAALAEHYAAYGKDEGRVTSMAAMREHFLALIDQDARLLEIGPFANPLFSGPTVEYLDVFDAPTLKKRAKKAGLSVTNCPKLIHHTDGLERVPDERFDIVFSSHAIEHQTDLIRHFQQVARVLKPDGLYFLIVPDKRFSFDHFRDSSTVGGVVDAYLNDRDRHTAANVIDQIVSSAHNDPWRHWAGDHGEREPVTATAVQAALDHYREANGDYIDVHGWKFTPDVFRSVTQTTFDMGLSPLMPVRVYQTPRNTFEFTAVLGRP